MFIRRDYYVCKRQPVTELRDALTTFYISSTLQQNAMRILLIATCHFQHVALVVSLLAHGQDGELSRRQFFDDNAIPFLVGVSSGTAFSLFPSDALASGNELPMSVRDYTKLAPLGGSVTVSQEDKTRNLSLQEIARRLQNDLGTGSTGQGGYIISGDISTDLFRDDCTFIDPTNRVKRLSQYQNALRILFDPKRSTVSIIDPFTVDEGTRTIRISTITLESSRIHIRGNNHLQN